MPSESTGNRPGQAVPRTSLGISNYSALTASPRDGGAPATHQGRSFASARDRPLFCAVPGVALRGGGASRRRRSRSRHHPPATRHPCGLASGSALTRHRRTLANPSPCDPRSTPPTSIMAGFLSGAACSSSFPKTTRYCPRSGRHDRRDRPVQEPGAGLYSAVRGFAPPGSTKPANAVFALRVTIPVAYAR